MTNRNYSNTALDTTLSGSLTALATTLVVASATGWPSAPFAAVLDPGDPVNEEIVLVTAVAGTTWTVTRGYDGTVAAVHASGAAVRHAAIAADFADLQAAAALIASSTVLGHIKVGSGLSIDGDGVLSASGGGGGAVDSVNGQTGVVVLAAADVGAGGIDTLNTWTLGQTIQGHSAIGADATPDDGSLLYPGDTFNSVVVVAERLTDLSTTYVEGATIYTQLDPSGTPIAAVYGADIEVFTSASNAADYPYIAGVFGGANHLGEGIVSILRGLVYFVSNAGAGAVTDMAALNVGIDNSGGGTVTAGKSIVIDAPSGSFSSTTGIDISGHDLAIRADAGATFGGHSAMGAEAAPDDGSLLYPGGGTYKTIVTVAEEITDMTVDTVDGINVQVLLNPSGAVNAWGFGVEVDVATKASNAADYPLLVGISGRATHNGPGTADALVGMQFNANNDGAGAVTDQVAVTIGVNNNGAGAVAAGTTLRLAAPNGVFGSTTGLAILGHDTAIETDSGATFGGDVIAPNLLTTTAAALAYQPLDADLTAIAGLSTTAFGRALLELDDAAALADAAALGTIATQNANSVSISGGVITGITDLAVADGGTGASTASAARSNFGIKGRIVAMHANLAGA